MTPRGRWRRVLFGALAGVLVAAHVLVAAVGVDQAARWLGGIAVGVLVTVLVVLHVVAARRLVVRRRRARRSTHIRRQP